MTTDESGSLRLARADDDVALISLWGRLFDDGDAASGMPWTSAASEWFAHAVDAGGTARLPLIVVGDEIVATAVGTLEIGVPNPYCPRGRTVRLAQVITLPEHRRRGHAAMLIGDIIGWARSISADRVDLSATPEGRRLYEDLGFVATSAPRMKLVL